MAGMSLFAGGGVRANSGGMSNVPNPATASQAAFGTGYSSGGYPSTTSALLPNDPFGVALWAAVLAAVGLIVIRHSLPG